MSATKLQKLARLSVLILAGSLFWIHQLFERFGSNASIDDSTLMAPQMVMSTATLISPVPQSFCTAPATHRWIRNPKIDGREYVTVLIKGVQSATCNFRFALEQFLSESKWLSKDILLVWGESDALITKDFQAQEEDSSAIMRQAIVLDFNGAADKSLKLLFDTTDGTLPNQDWINVFAKEARRVGLSVDVSSGWDGIQKRFHKSEIGLHGLFISNGISAYTVLVGDSDQQKLLQSVDRCLKAASNLEQQLHHSTHLYFFRSLDQFVGIGEYLPPLLLCLVPFFVAAARFDNKNVGSILVGTLGRLGTVIFVPLTLLRPELSLWVIPAVSLTSTVFFILSGNFL